MEGLFTFDAYFHRNDVAYDDIEIDTEEFLHVDNEPSWILDTEKAVPVKSYNLSENSHDNTPMVKRVKKKIKFVTCDQCPRIFETKIGLAVHARTHTDYKSRLCPYDGCGQLFSQKANLITHLRRHNWSGSFETCFKCCGRSFKNNTTFQRHILNHAGQRPHQCTTCWLRFDQNHQLIVHQRRMFH